MPRIQVTAPQGALSKQDQDAMISRLSNAVLKSEGAQIEDPAAQSLVWADYDERPAGSSYVGGKNLDKPPFIVSVTTPQGALNDGTRAELVAEIGAIVDDIVGAYDDRLNHWVMLYEVTDGGWGGASQVFRLGDIQNAMNIKAA